MMGAWGGGDGRALLFNPVFSDPTFHPTPHLALHAPLPRQVSVGELRKQLLAHLLGPEGTASVGSTRLREAGGEVREGHEGNSVRGKER